jgi:hypothetical protein
LQGCTVEVHGGEDDAVEEVGGHGVDVLLKFVS